MEATEYKKLGKLFGIAVMVLALLIVVPSSFALNETQSHGTDLNADYGEPVSLASPLTKADYYFNSSNENAGDGSVDNPYRDLTPQRIKENSNIHLANGQYSLSKGKTVNGVSFIGENPEKTIINYTGNKNCGEFDLDSGNKLVLKNITFIGFNFYTAGGTLQAENCIFKNSIAPSQDFSGTDLVNSAVNSFGGAIFAESSGYKNPKVSINNCTFINNTAEYGGAVYVCSGELSIANSAFNGNYAYNYGGAVAALYEVKVKVENTTFYDDRSINDAGGAIYLLYSTLSAKNISISNCSSSFGGALASLDSKVTVNYLNASDNAAEFDGGAIYQMYNDISLTNSSFTGNSARNGGAIFVDDVDMFEMAFNYFNRNNAYLVGGAVYSLLANSSSINNNSYSGNKADHADDTYETDKVGMIIGSGNYTLIYSNYTYDGELPKRYSLVDENMTTPVKDQQHGGNCWAFASIAALESAILKATGQSVLLSEENMKNIAELFSDYGWNWETNEGGIDEMSIGYLASWLGPVFSSLDEYDDYSMLSSVFDSYTHIQNIMYITRDSCTDNDAIKRAVMSYGGVAAAIFMDTDYCFKEKTNAYYCPDAEYANHEIVIVGWDDSYSRNNFKKAPPGNGAWICKNSWNTDWGDEGYFYVSYYDSMVGQVGVSDTCYVFLFNDSERYEKNYQYDIIGKTDYFTGFGESLWVQNIFEAQDDELLAGVSTYFRKTTDYELFIYVNDDLAFCKNGTCTPGYTTINLGKYVPLHSGDEFRVMFKLTAEDVEFAISEVSSSNKLFYAPGVSFFSRNGTAWTDLFDYEAHVDDDGGHDYYSQVAAIKAFTIAGSARPSISFNVSTDYNRANITVNVEDLFQDRIVYYGNISVNLEGIDYVLSLNDGKINICHEFNDVGEYEITARFANFSAGTKLNITEVELIFNSAVDVDANNVSISVESSSGVNTTLNVSVNNESYQIRIVDGRGNLTLINLDFGFYEVFAGVDDDSYVGNFTSSFNITVSRTVIEASDVVSYHDVSGNCSARVMDVYGNPVVSRQISFAVGGRVFNATTDEEGLASAAIELNGNERIVIRFEGDGEYLPANATAKVEVKALPINISATVDVEANNVLISVESLSRVNTVLNADVNSQSYEIPVAAGKGNLTLNDLDFGFYEVFAGVDDEFYTGSFTASFNISVSRTVIEASDVVSYHEVLRNCSARVMDVYGNPVVSRQVSFILEGRTFNATTDKDGFASAAIELNGNATMEIRFNGDDEYFPANASVNVVLKPSIVLFKSDYLAGSQYQAYLVDKNGAPLNDVMIKVFIDGAEYSAVAAGGMISVPLNLSAGNHSVFFTNTVTGEEACQNISCVSRIMGNEDIEIYYLSQKAYKIRIYGDDANPVGADETVEIIVAQDSCQIKTDDEGYAYYDVDLKPGEYTITATYKGFTVSNSILVKPLLTAKDITRKKAKKIKFSAKLVDGNGNPDKGKKITFKINGKKYKAKTNAKGIAKIKIKNLKAGKYTIKTKYGKSKIKNRIRIKK